VIYTAKKLFYLTGQGAMDDNVLLDTGPDPWPDNRWYILGTACFLFIALFERARRDGQIILTLLFWY
jgi:hypothetical protein